MKMYSLMKALLTGRLQSFLCSILRTDHRSFSISIFFLLGLLLNSVSAQAAVVEHSGTISTQTTWSAADVHLITGDITINAGVKLTVEPGTVVKFNANRRLDVNGMLWAVGNASQRITFTSYRDDSVGGDTNGDGLSQGQAGDWRRIYFSDTVTDSQTRLEHVDIRYGGTRSQIRKPAWSMRTSATEGAATRAMFIYTVRASRWSPVRSPTGLTWAYTVMIVRL